MPPPLHQYPISYIRAFAYHPLAFPQPMAPITTYTVRNPLPSRSLTQQQLPNLQNPQEFGPPPTTPKSTTTSTTTTTPVPTTTQSFFSGSQAMPQFSARGEFGQRQLPVNAYQNYGGYPYYYNNQYQYRYDDAPSNQFSGRVYGGGESNYQPYSMDPMTYQFIPTSITPIQPQGSVKFVPCMCPVAVQVSPSMSIKERNSEPENSILSGSSTESITSPSTSSEEESMEEAK